MQKLFKLFTVYISWRAR